MNPPKNILVTDFSFQARRTYHCAAALAKKFGATLHICHVEDALPPLFSDVPAEEYLAELKTAVEREVDSVDFDGLPVVPHLLQDRQAFEALNVFAGSAGIDLIVLSTQPDGRAALPARELRGAGRQDIFDSRAGASSEGGPIRRDRPEDGARPDRFLREGDGRAARRAPPFRDVRMPARTPALPGGCLRGFSHLPSRATTAASVSTTTLFSSRTPGSSIASASRGAIGSASSFRRERSS